MNDMISIANQIVIYSVCYCFFFIIYVYALYNIGKFIVRILTAAYRRVKADWKAWHPDKKDDQ